MSASAAFAMSDVSAATTATSSPMKRTSSRKIVSSPRNAAFGALKRWRMSCTPASARAFASSIARPRGDAGGDDVQVRAAAAQVAGDGALHVVLGGRGVAAEQRDDRHDLARRAEAALIRVVSDERLLHRMQLPVGTDALDRLDGATLA